MRVTTLTLISCVCAFATNINAQETASEIQNPKAAIEASKMAIPDATSSIGNVETEKAPVLPLAVTLSPEGKLIGQATADVNGKEMPVEANITIMKDGVVISSIVADEDGSFAFPNVAPGAYQMYGSAASYAGHQPINVVPGFGGGSPVHLGLAPYTGAQYGSYSGATVGSFGGGGFGYGGGGYASGGGFAGGGGGAFAGGGGGGLRLLTIGGVTAGIVLAVSDDEDASPSQ